MYEDDQCVLVKRIDKKGYVPCIKILPHPEVRKRLIGGAKNNYIISEAFADGHGPSFTFGVHVNDPNFTEQFFKSKGGVRIERAYGDGCKLEYYIDNYGIAYGWRWIEYKH